MSLYDYDRRPGKRQAGGIDPQEDVAALLPALGASLSTFSASDIAHATYVFDYLASQNRDPKVRGFANALATEYAKRFAEWLGYVFLNRANMTRQTRAVKDMQTALASWVEAIPDMLISSPRLLTDYIPKGAAKFFNTEKLNAIGSKILKVVYREWAKSQVGGRQAASLSELPIQYNSRAKRYEIPKGKMTYPHRNRLKDLGFSFDGMVWWTALLDSNVLRQLPQAAQLQRGKPPPKPTGSPKKWFFEDWLPGNIDRFSKVFNGYGRSEGVPYEFNFTVGGSGVKVDFRRNIQTVAEAIAELESRYGGTSDRDGWMAAVQSYKELMKASGKAAMKAVDRANDLEHSHGAMMEHFPPGVRRWYPAFLDFKFSGNIWQLIKAIKDEDLRVISSELLPVSDRKERLAPAKTDTRTPRGLALEISSQPGKARKRKRLEFIKQEHPDMYPEVLKELEAKGLNLT